MAEVTTDPSDERPVRSVLIYDGECAYCSAAATALRRLPTTGVVPWEHEAAQAFLEAQFGEPPFAMFLVDLEDGTVAAGRSAARELSERAGVPMLVADLLGDNYERLADAIQRSIGGRSPDPYHDTFPIGDDALPLADRLADVATPSTIIVS